MAASTSIPRNSRPTSFFRPRIRASRRPLRVLPTSLLLLLLLSPPGTAVVVSVSAFHAPPPLGPHAISSSSSLPRSPSSVRMADDGGDGGKKVAGSFFNPVPEGGGDENGDENRGGNEGSDNGGDAPSSSVPAGSGEEDAFEKSLREMLDKRRGGSNASKPSTVGGVPTSKATGFGKPNTSVVKKFSAPVASKRRDGDDAPYVAIGPGGKKLNDVNNPEYDDQGYTLYADEETGEKSRVFEALVRYPCEFKVKIVGADEGAFVPEMVALVAESCGVDVGAVKYRERKNGRWTSVTVDAPVQSAEMLYELYENIDRDPRVKFKF